MIFVKVKNGLANRLRVLNSFWFFANKNNNPLFLCWSAGEGFSEESFFDFFENNYGLTFVNDDQYEEMTKKYFNLDQTIKKSIDNPNLHLKNKPIEEILELMKENFCYYGDSCLEHMMPDQFHSDNSFLRSILPKSDILFEIDSVSSLFQDKTIGLHVRRGDAWGEYKHSHFFKQSSDEAFFAAIDREIEMDSSVNFFLSTDTKSTQDLFLKKFPDRIITNKNKPFFDSKSIHEPKPYQRHALIDMMLLSRTSKIIGTNWSSFSKISSLIGGNKLEIAK